MSLLFGLTIGSGGGAALPSGFLLGFLSEVRAPGLTGFLMKSGISDSFAPFWGLAGPLPFFLVCALEVLDESWRT
jgi:hypothetical protein